MKGKQYLKEVGAMALGGGVSFASFYAVALANAGVLDIDMRTDFIQARL